MSEARLTFPLPTPTTDDTRHQVRARPRKHAALTTLYPRSPYARQHDAMRCCSCCHAHVPRYCLPFLPHHRNHSAATALLRAATAAACTLMASHCCCLATATLLPSPPTLQQKQTTKACIGACKLPPPSPPSQPPLLFAFTASTAPVASITTSPIDLTANAIASAASTSQPTCRLPVNPSAIAMSSTSPPFLTEETYKSVGVCCVVNSRCFRVSCSLVGSQ